MDDRRTELTKALVRQGLRGGSAGTETTLGMKGASSQGTALSAMGWANALLDREEGEIEPMHSPAVGEEDRRFENSEAGATKAPARVRWDNTREPSPGGAARPVLRLVHSSSRRRPTRYVIGPRLVLIDGGKG
ncbi:hypothetical protein [Devosia sp. Naph2]|uniref:hypothetical protein n=1 Tax=Devosia polycyclovorans TaxID=3345148 RepID=UPI0035CF668A